MGSGGVEAPKARIYVKIPLDRVGVLIGEKGSVKRDIERATGTTLTIESESGSVAIELSENAPDPSALLKARDVVLAIGRGFSPQRAYRLFNDDQILDVIDIKQYVGDSKNAQVRVKGRVIGEAGKTRRIIEEMTGAYVSVYGHTVAIIGNYDQVRVAREAIEMLLRGAQHSTVYRYLERAHRELMRRELSLWRGGYE
ncbi:MAG: RNA-processing protein [Candidatus Methanomethylicota archaeon]|uniref:RNA-processing protein n=1 Tax=Thermoproteota archaeon TaxID=2056631 RepID=A0A497EZF4_9CREN|nr:MAG: RNA-processing protein [Candidatus Verstraetearchaeota archaeon]RLE52773.1 MAG: RNA-processing protein [Candidatus Verstraetearchaeota archaeon]